MKKIFVIVCIALTAALKGEAQSAFSEFAGTDTLAHEFILGDTANTIQFGGRISGYYEYRDLKNISFNRKHDGWAVKDLDLDVLGKTKNNFRYEIQYSLADIVTAAATRNTADPASPGFKAAYIQYEGKLKVKFGYDKLPYALGSITPGHLTAFWSHNNINGGDYFSRRDFGLTLNYTALHHHINLFAGAYSGMGENFFEYGNDPSGTFEYIARAEYTLTGKMKYRLIDENRSSKPQLRIAGNIRYMDKSQPGNSTVPFANTYPDAVGAYSTRICNGTRTVIGADAIFLYKGFSASFEIHKLTLQPVDTGDALFYNTPNSYNKGGVNAGGYILNANYYLAKIKTVFSATFEDDRANDLAGNDQQWLTVACSYNLNSFNSCAKIEYYNALKEDAVCNPLKYVWQLRIGYQIVF
jgi:Phosphate-selective porin O and P